MHCVEVGLTRTVLIEDKLPVDALKIDRSFVSSLLLPGRPAIVESIMALARTLKQAKPKSLSALVLAAADPRGYERAF